MVRVGNWMGIRPNVSASKTLELYDLGADPKEKNDVAAQHPDIVAKLTKLLEEQHVKSTVFPIRGLDGDVPGAPAAPKKKGKKKSEV
jgi:arylsulfatase A